MELAMVGILLMSMTVMVYVDGAHRLGPEYPRSDANPDLVSKTEALTLDMLGHGGGVGQQFAVEFPSYNLHLESNKKEQAYAILQKCFLTLTKIHSEYSNVQRINDMGIPESQHLGRWTIDLKIEPNFHKSIPIIPGDNFVKQLYIPNFELELRNGKLAFTSNETNITVLTSTSKDYIEEQQEAPSIPINNFKDLTEGGHQSDPITGTISSYSVYFIIYQSKDILDIILRKMNGV